jgi:hypothetical protein
MNTAKDWASQFLRVGIAVIPVQYQDKKPIGKWEQYQHTLPSRIDGWFMRPINYGVVVGWRNLVVVDFDTLQEYTRWVMWARRRGDLAAYVLDTAFKVRTARGVHVYLTTTEPAQNHKLPGLDIKARSGYVLGPGSVHPTGAIYEPMQDVLNFPQVERVSDLLPADLLLETTLPAQVKRPIQVQRSGDPWIAAMDASIPGTGAVEKIKKTLTVESFFPQAQTTGPGWSVDLCPFHDDRSPSFWLNTEQQLCGCFAGCTAKPLDVINLYARLHGMNNDDAIRILVRML